MIYKLKKSTCWRISGNSLAYMFWINYDFNSERYLFLIFKMFSIQTVRYFKCSNPLWMVLSSLNCHLSHTSQLTKVHLYPLFHVVCSGRPGSSLTSTSRAIDPCIAGPVVCIPLRRAWTWKWLVSISLLEKTNHSSLSIKRQSQQLLYLKNIYSLSNWYRSIFLFTTCWTYFGRRCNVGVWNISTLYSQRGVTI